MDNLQNFRRTGYCGTFTAANIGQEIAVCGWVQRQRNLGGLIFVDLRDRTGLLQLSFDDSTPRDLFEKAASLRGEYVIAAKGLVRERESKNPDLPTGDIEVKVTELRLLAKAATPPFEIVENSDVKDAVRLKYRYLDLRRPDMQRMIALRHKIVKICRDYFDEQGFLEIETPILTKSTPEGARDYLVPSRVHPGKFYALPQSPQQYKQLLMLAGFDRYFQIARCFRDEDLRADRQPEFTQIDLEMSFLDEEQIQTIQEGFLKRVFKEVLDVDVQTPSWSGPGPRTGTWSSSWGTPRTRWSLPPWAPCASSAPSSWASWTPRTSSSSGSPSSPCSSGPRRRAGTRPCTTPSPPP